MNLKIIINALLIIFVLHLLLQNMEYSVEIGNSNSSKSMDFLLGSNKVENFEARDNLLKFLETDDPKPSNSNLENNNTPNFSSDNQDISKFFTNYDNLDEKELSNQLKPLNDYDRSQEYMDGEQSMLSQQWQYKNETPMNGGSLGNNMSVVGFDSLDSNFASINFDDSVPKVEELEDLRNGMSQKMSS